MAWCFSLKARFTVINTRREAHLALDVGSDPSVQGALDCWQSADAGCIVPLNLTVYILTV